MLAPGTHIAGYEIEGLLGQGGMGVVYEATQLTLGRRVALKLLSEELGTDVSFSERFRREGRAQAALEHPHIVTVFEAGEIDGRLFLAMRLIRGQTLRELIRAREFELGRALRILGPVADALDSAHAVGLIHRDVKAQNILVDSRDHSYLTDFGLTKSTDQTGFTRTGRFVGTIANISPEQIRGEDETRATDIYALTTVLYECLTGEPPYQRPTEAAVLYAHLNDPAPRVTDERPELPAALDDVIARGMAKDPADRHPSAAALVLDAGRAAASPREAREHRPLGYTPTTTGSVPESEAPGAVALADTPVYAVPVATTTADASVIERRQVTPRAGIGNLAAVAGLAALVTGAVGFVVGNSGAGPPALKQQVSDGTIAVTAPENWSREPTDGGRLGLRHGFTLRSADGGSGVTLGESSATGKVLLPEQLRPAKGSPPAGNAVQLGQLPGLRYADVEAGALRGKRAAVYATPTSRGVATIVCMAKPSAFPDFADTCNRIAKTARLAAGVLPQPLAPSRRYADGLDKAVRALRRARTKPARRLRTARTPVGQVRSAQTLAATYRGHALALKKIPPSAQERGAHERLAGAASRSATAYAALAAAVGRGDAGAYSEARRDVRAAEDDYRSALGTLRELGYRAR